ncbi:DUF1488 family protein [Rhodovibrio salinarum]|nr:DUF1488 family protein [Rhodovibrio salinarum]
MSETKRLQLEETDARYDGETESVRLDARIGHARLEVIVSAEAIEELVGEAPLSAERLIDGAEAYRVQIADVARRKAGPKVPAGGALLLTGRDMPKRSTKPSGSVH